MDHQELRHEILRLAQQYHHEKFAHHEFKPGETIVRYAGRVFDENELTNLVDSSLDFWLTAGPHAEAFENEFAEDDTKNINDSNKKDIN